MYVLHIFQGYDRDYGAIGLFVEHRVDTFDVQIGKMVRNYTETICCSVCIVNSAPWKESYFAAKTYVL